MARERKVIQLGPWTGGMNTRDDPRLIPDNEAVNIVNWDVGDDGSLIPRRGWYQTSTGYAHAYPLCIYVASNDNSRCICSVQVVDTAGSEQSKFFYTAGPTPAIFTLKDAAAADIQRDGRFVTGFLYNGKIYFVPDYESGLAAGVGFRKTNTGNNDPVDVAAMPAGKFSWVMNDRAFIFNPRNGRLYWSKATDADTWLTSGTGTAGVDTGGFVDIDPNDNPFLDCVVVHDTVYFIRSDRIYTFRFSSDPSTDGAINQIANSEGAVAGCAYNNQLVLVTPKGLYYFTNGYYTLITDKVRFTDALGELVTKYEYNEVGVIDHTLWSSQLITTTPAADLTDGNYQQIAVNMRNGAASQYQSQSPILTPYGKMLSDGRYSYRMAKNESSIENTTYVLAIAHDRDYYVSEVGARDDYYAIETKMYDFGTTRSSWKRMRTATIDYDIDPDRINKDVDLTLLYEDSADGSQNSSGIVTLTSGDMGRVAVANARFRTIQLIAEINGSDVNTNGGGVWLRKFLLLISIGEFEQKQAV